MLNFYFPILSYFHIKAADLPVTLSLTTKFRPKESHDQDLSVDNSVLDWFRYDTSLKT